MSIASPETHYFEPKHITEFPNLEGVEPGDECYIVLNPNSKNDPVKMIFCWCERTGEAGFLMGSPPDELERHDDERQHTSVITKGFWLGKYLITNRQWKIFPELQAKRDSENDDYPVNMVYYVECKKFFKKANEQLKHQFGKQLGDKKMNFPTEAQWEWACRAGTQTPFGIGQGESLNRQMANFSGEYPYGKDRNSFKWLEQENLTKVGCFPPNNWGLHDMQDSYWSDVTICMENIHKES